MAKKQKCRGKGFGTLVKRGNTFYARWTKDGKTYVETTGTSVKKDALVILLEKTARFRLGSEEKTLLNLAATIGDVQSQIAKIEEDEPSISIAHGWQAYISQLKKPDTGVNTLEIYRTQYEHFARWMLANNPDVKELRHVNDEHATAYANNLLKTVASSTFNKYVNVLALVWKVLKKAAKIKDNPWDADHITRRKFVNYRRREFTVEELGRIIEASSGEMRRLIALGIYCGLRLGDAACLQWSGVDMVKKTISLIPQKTARKQKRVTLSIHKMLYMMLQETTPEKRRGYVMPTIADRYQNLPSAFSRDLSLLFKSAGIETVVKGEGKRNHAGCGYHSLRHTFVSLCASSGVSQSVVQALVGHGSPSMTEHYTHIAIETNRKAIDTLPSITGTNTLPMATEATGAKLDGILAMLDGLTDAELITLKQSIANTELKRKA